jgi:hypothetical protein
MAASEPRQIGAISWFDLTVADAVGIREFYRSVVGWDSTEVPMDGHSDFCMNDPADGRTLAGICHARGPNAVLPPQSLIYITVDDLDRSIARCIELGGATVGEPRSLGGQGRYCVIRDPAGAVAALFEPAGDDTKA